MNLKSAIINAFSEMAKEKNIDRDILESVIQDSFKKVMQKKSQHLFKRDLHVIALLY